MRKIEVRSSKPKFPLRRVSHEERVELGRKIASQILDTHKDAVLAICIYASTAKKLEKAVAENDRADFTEELRWAAETMTESFAAVRNAHLKGDLKDIRTRAFYMAWDTARVVFLLNRKYVLTTSWFWKQLFECQEQPKGFRKLVDVVAGFEKSTNSELVDAAEELWRETMLMVQARGVSIESKDITV